MKLLPPRH